MAELIEMPVGGRAAPPGEWPPAGAAPDWKERERALDIGASWIVEAPAGSGKTALLIQRYLKLLAEGEVDRPEQVLAITFTRAATEEIKQRVRAELEAAARGGGVSNPFERTTRSLAVAVLRRDAELGWGLLESPRRFNVRTIDSVSAEIARALPLTSGGDAGMSPTAEPEPLYREAARRTLLQLGGADRLLHRALESMLLLRDGSLSDCERLITEMLGARDQWGELVPVGREELTEERLEGTARRQLDEALELAVCRGLSELTRVMPAGFVERLTEAAAEMGERPGYGGGSSPLEICRGMRSAPEATGEALDHWRALIHLLLTSGKSWRKGLNVRQLGFEASEADKERLRDLTAEVQDSPELLPVLCRVRALPPARYPDEQWEAAKAIFRVLSRALLELQLLFAERGVCDFAEPALLALTALRQENGVESYESAHGMELRHLLVDEMQDTSKSQYELIERLTEEWSAERKTVFLVGDPKQSIYLFRQARVERFVATMEACRIGDMPLGRVRLTANFRSQGGLVHSFNGEFSRIFLPGEEMGAATTFTAAQAVRPALREAAGEGGLAWHAELAAGTAEEIGERKRSVDRGNARTVREVAERWRARPLPGGRTEPWSIAVLVRSRVELREIVSALKEDRGEGSLPFRAVKIEPLKEQREVLDLLALTRALLHGADRAAWWAVLRAPWCGLGLGELHLLAGEDDGRLAQKTVMELVRSRRDRLEAESVRRLERVWPVLEAAVRKSSKLRVPELVERTWRSLGGDAALSADELSNALRYLELLDEVDREAGGFDLGQLNRKMERLYAAAGAAPGAIDLMTIHGAKGLEWDVVMVPELERRAPPVRSRLLDWEEVEGEAGSAAGVVLAPIKGKGKESEALQGWIRGLRSERESMERKRLFYVACTRAREELHLFGTATVAKDGEIRPEAGSLLQAAWPAAKERFAQCAEPVRAPAEDAGLALAASAEEEAADLPRPALLERFPAGFDPMARFTGKERFLDRKNEEVRPRFERPQGSFAARSFGNAVHAFLELAARRLATGAEAQRVGAEVLGWKDRIAAVLRGDGLAPALVERLAGRAIVAVANTLRDPVGLWLLGERVEAASEYALTAWNEGWSRVRMDRVFRAGAEPGAEGSEFLWIVDYKTGTHGAEGLELFLERERMKYAAQLEGYARATGTEGVRVGLWYPMASRLVWWIAAGARSERGG